MVSESVWRRILYFGTGLVLAVSIILACIVIPSVKMDTSIYAAPERAVPAIWVVVIIHLLIVAALIWTIIVNKRGLQINKELLVASGVAPIILSLVMMDAAFAYIDNPDTHIAAILIFICIGFDIIAAVLSFTARYSYRKL
jgi:hypothetical protein